MFASTGSKLTLLRKLYSSLAWFLASLNAQPPVDFKSPRDYGAGLCPVVSRERGRCLVLNGGRVGLWPARACHTFCKEAWHRCSTFSNTVSLLGTESSEALLVESLRSPSPCTLFTWYYFVLSFWCSFISSLHNFCVSLSLNLSCWDIICSFL